MVALPLPPVEGSRAISAPQNPESKTESSSRGVGVVSAPPALIASTVSGGRPPLARMKTRQRCVVAAPSVIAATPQSAATRASTDRHRTPLASRPIARASAATIAVTRRPFGRSCCRFPQRPSMLQRRPPSGAVEHLSRLQIDHLIFSLVKLVVSAHRGTSKIVRHIQYAGTIRGLNRTRALF